MIEPLGVWADERRRDPRDGVLDPLFPPAWALRRRLDPAGLRAALARRASPSAPPPLTDRWEWRVAELRDVGSTATVVDPAAYPYQTYPEQLSPTVRDFVLGEWSPDWMPHFLEVWPPGLDDPVRKVDGAAVHFPPESV